MERRLKDEYLEKGFCRIPQCFPLALIHTWAKDLHWLVETQLRRLGLELSDEPDPVRCLSCSLIKLWQAKPEAQSWIYDEVNRRPWMFELASSRLLLGWVQEMLGTDRIAIHPRINMIMNMPHHEWHVAYWHQDRFYNPAHLISYIPWQDTGAFNGGLKVAVGEHRRGLLPHINPHNPRNKWLVIPEEVVSSFADIKQL